MINSLKKILKNKLISYSNKTSEPLTKEILNNIIFPIFDVIDDNQDEIEDKLGKFGEIGEEVKLLKKKVLRLEQKIQNLESK